MKGEVTVAIVAIQSWHSSKTFLFSRWSITMSSARAWPSIASDPCKTPEWWCAHRHHPKCQKVVGNLESSPPRPACNVVHLVSSLLPQIPWQIMFHYHLYLQLGRAPLTFLSENFDRQKKNLGVDEILYAETKQFGTDLYVETVFVDIFSNHFQHSRAFTHAVCIPSFFDSLLTCP